MSSADFVLDNPMLIKHLRSRLRPAQVAPWLVVITVLCLFIVWSGQALNWFRNGFALSMMLGLEAILLGIVGTQQIAGAVGSARESGVIDFHRVSPQPPSWLTLGFWLGAPIREYALFLVTVPFAIFLAALSPLGVLGLLLVWVAMFICAWILQLMALLATLVSKKPKGGTRGGIAGIVMLGIFLGRPIGLGLFYASTSLSGESQSIDFFGIPVNWLLFFFLYSLPLLGFLFLACTRKMRSERAHPYTKAEAVAAMGVLSFLTVGGAWNVGESIGVFLGIVYVLLAGAMVLTTTITPSQAEYARGLRLAYHQGRRRPSPWTDEGMNRLAVLLIAGILFLACTAYSQAVGSGASGGGSSDAFTIAIAVFVLAYFGLGLQYFLFRLPRSGRTYFQLFLFLVWIVPLLGGSIAAGTGAVRPVYEALLGLSPITGISLSNTGTSSAMGLQEEIGSETARLACVLPAIAFAFIFNFLLVACQRKLDLVVRGNLGPKKKDPSPFDFMDEGVELPKVEGIHELA